ncbi:MAG: glycosyltransferase [Desulfobacteraceae bacterium]|nr:MAG: glycosyltransferase [Desulfobacteraceae bacterium]
MKKISVTTTCFNEEKNLHEFYERLVRVFQKLERYDYEIIVADNCSTDGSRQILREIASRDKHFKVIFNSRNFGHLRSPHNALRKATGDAVIPMSSDLQEPPEVIPELVSQWEAGYHVVVAVKPKSREGFPMSFVRRFYYKLLARMSDSQQIIENFTGFGLYDRKFMDALEKYHDPYPYFRGLVTEIGFRRTSLEYVPGKRKHGKSKNNFFTLYDIAMTGFINHSKLPLRLAMFIGFCLAFFSFLISIGYFIYKLLYWQTFSLGIAPLVIGLFFFFAVQLIFMGIVGEYVGAILTQVKDYPLVIEDEKLNF